MSVVEILKHANFHIIKAARFSETDIQELLLKLNDSVKSPDKNVRTRALWVISKQTFPAEVIGKVVSMVFVCFFNTYHFKNSGLFDLYFFGSVF